MHEKNSCVEIINPLFACQLYHQPRFFLSFLFCSSILHYSFGYDTVLPQNESRVLSGNHISIFYCLRGIHFFDPSRSRPITSSLLKFVPSKTCFAWWCRYPWIYWKGLIIFLWNSEIFFHAEWVQIKGRLYSTEGGFAMFTQKTKKFPSATSPSFCFRPWSIYLFSR